MVYYLCLWLRTLSVVNKSLFLEIKRFGVDVFRLRKFILLWRFLYEKLLTDDLLLHWGFSFSSMCSWYCKATEAPHHLFLGCSFSHFLWQFGAKF